MQDLLWFASLKCLSNYGYQAISLTKCFTIYGWRCYFAASKCTFQYVNWNYFAQYCVSFGYKMPLKMQLSHSYAAQNAIYTQNTSLLCTNLCKYCASISQLLPVISVMNCLFSYELLAILSQISYLQVHFFKNARPFVCVTIYL